MNEKYASNVDDRVCIWFGVMDLGNLGGISSVVETLAAEFTDRGHVVGYITVNPAVRAPGVKGAVFHVNRFEKHTSLHPHAYLYPGPFGTKLAIKRLLSRPWRFWRDRRFQRFFERLPSGDCVIFAEPGVSQLLFRTGYLTHTGRRPVTIGQAHSSLEGMLNWGLDDAIRETIELVDHFVVLSDTDIADFETHFQHNVIAIPNPCAIVPTVNAQESDLNELVYLGRLSGEKRVDVLCDAFDMVARDVPGWRLNLYGDGVDRERLEHHVKTLKSSAQIRFHGREDNPARAFSGASLAILTSSFEGLPMTLIEAARCGVPTVSTASSKAVADIVAECGYLTPDSDSDSIARTLRAAMEDPEGRKERAARCIEVGARYSPGRVVDSWMDLIETSRRSQLCGSPWRKRFPHLRSRL